MSNELSESWREALPGLAYKGAIGHVFQIRHVSSVRDMAWCDKRKVWTSPRMGKVYTYTDAVRTMLRNELPDQGRWYAIGLNLYSVE